MGLRIKFTDSHVVSIFFARARVPVCTQVKFVHLSGFRGLLLRIMSFQLHLAMDSAGFIILFMYCVIVCT